MKTYTVVGFDPHSKNTEKPGVFVDHVEGKNAKHVAGIEVENRPKCHIFAIFEGELLDESEPWKFPLGVMEVARVKNPHAYEPWTPTEEAKVLKMVKEDKPLTEIAMVTGRSPKALRSHISEIRIAHPVKRTNRFAVDGTRWTHTGEGSGPEEFGKPIVKLDAKDGTYTAAVMQFKGIKGFIVRTGDHTEPGFRSVADAQIAAQLQFPKK